MTILKLGVIDIPYAYDQEQLGKKGKPIKKKKKITLSITTGDVAEILEKKYHPMETFFEVHRQEIGDEIAKAYVGSFQRLHATGQGPDNPAQGAMDWMQNRFKEFLAKREMEGLGIPGVPTQAALDGVSHRFAHPYAKRPSRPSFIDTGLYQASARFWIE